MTLTIPEAKRARTDGGSGDAVVTLEEGSLSHIAAKEFFKDSPDTKVQGVMSIARGFQAVSSGEATYGVFPVENSSAGSITVTLDQLVQHNVVICGEYGMRDMYFLCAKRKEVTLETVKCVMSHPQVLEACSTFLREGLKSASGDDGADGLRLQPMKSTTEAAKQMVRDAEAGGVHTAVVCTREAASLHGLRILRENIGNDAHVETRYILVCRPGVAESARKAGKPIPFPRGARNPIQKHSAVFAIRNQSASLFKLLGCFGMRDVDVLKVETRPIAGGAQAPEGLDKNIPRLWDYLFFVDYRTPLGQTEEQEAQLQAALAEFSLWRRDLGSYKSQISSGKMKEAPAWEERVDLMHFG